MAIVVHTLRILQSTTTMLSLVSRMARPMARSYSTAAPAATRKVGAFRGGFVGFLFGVTATGVASHFYFLDEYTKSWNVVVVDILKLQQSISSLEEHVKKLEEK